MIFFFFTLFLSHATDDPLADGLQKNCLRFCLVKSTAAADTTTSDTIYAKQWSNLIHYPAEINGVHGALGDCEDNDLCFDYTIEYPTYENPIIFYTKGYDALLIDLIILRDNDDNVYEWGQLGYDAFCLSTDWSDHHGEWQDRTDACFYAIKLWQTNVGAGNRDHAWGWHGWYTGTAGCNNNCAWAFDGLCDDGGPGAPYMVCNLGSDCYDCGIRSAEIAVGGVPNVEFSQTYESMEQCHKSENEEDCNEQETAWVQSILLDAEHWIEIDALQSNPGIALKLSKMSYSLAMKTSPTLVNFFAFIGAGFVLFMVATLCRSKTADFEEIPSEI